MQRLIKFRAWDKKAKNMFCIFDSQGQKDWFLPLWKDIFEVMQFTGLKDKNGKEIYEGDRVKIPDESDPLWQIVWHYKGFCLGRKRKETGVDWGANESGFVCYERTWADIEVIGNIYEE